MSAIDVDYKNTSKILIPLQMVQYFIDISERKGDWQSHKANQKFSMSGKVQM